MRSRSIRRVISAVAAAFGLLSLPRVASADWIDLSPGTPPPGHLSGIERVVLWMTATGLVVPMIYAGAYALEGEPPPENGKRDAGFILGGGLTGTVIGVSLPWIDRGEPAFTYTLVGGMLLGMGGVGVGGAVSSNPRAMWLGGSMGYGTFALYRMILSLNGYANYRGAAAAQIVLGVISTAGCLIDTAGATGGELYAAYGCGAVAGITTIHGMIKVAKPDPPRPPAPPGESQGAVAMYPMPWFGRESGGLSIAGSF